MSNEKLGAEQGREVSDHFYCARCNCRRYRNAEGKCEVCASYQAQRAELAYHARGAGRDELIDALQSRECNIHEMLDRFVPRGPSHHEIYHIDIRLAHALDKMRLEVERIIEKWNDGKNDSRSTLILFELSKTLREPGADTGTTPPEGRDIEQERLEADVPYSAEYLRGFEDGRRAATQRAPVEQGREKCKASPTADPPQDCDFPFCGCFALATKTIETLQECGWGKLAAPDHAREGALRMFVWTKSPSWAAVVLAEHVTQARTLLLEEIGSSGDGSCPEREAAAKWVKERTPVIWRGPNAEFALTDSAELREQEFHSEKLQRRVKELEQALANGKEGGE